MTRITRPVTEDEVCTGLDVPTGKWTAEDVAFWTGSPTYQPWKDVAAYFKGEKLRRAEQPPATPPG